jgi:D-apionate oxidoisomerase
MKTIALIGAGGKMGRRITHNLKSSRYDIHYVEINPDNVTLLKGMGITEITPAETAVPAADCVILAVPDTHIKSVARIMVPMMKPGTRVITLDPAAPHAGHLPERHDITYFVTHPCHPSVFNWEPSEANQKDFFGGERAKQAIVCALYQGPEEDYPRCEEVAKLMYAPVFRSHRITVEQMAMLEPALVETLAATLLTVMREGLEEVVKRGVPREAARDFMLGHMNIEMAVLFNEIPGVFSDACNKAIELGMPHLVNRDWKKIFDSDEIGKQIEGMITPS